MGPSRREAWKCQFCRAGGNQVVNDVENPPSSTLSSTPTPVVQASKRALCELTTSPAKSNKADDNTPVLAEIKKLRTEMRDIANSCEFFANKYDEINSNIIKNNQFMESLVKEISELKQNNVKKDETIKQMQVQINTLEQQIIKNNIEIKNIPPSMNEDLVEVVKAIGKTINYEIKDNEITDVYRTRPKNTERSLIIASFSSHFSKLHFVKQARAARPIELRSVMQNTTNATNSNREWSNATVFVNNQLSRQNKQLLWMAKEKAKQENWSYVWETAGRVLARKNESAKTITIDTVDDVSLITRA